MNFAQRYKRLSFWNKIGFWGSLASIISFIYIFIPSQNNTPLPISIGPTEAVTESTSPGEISYNKARDNLVRSGKSIELIELLIYFHVRNDFKSIALDFSHGTMGQLPIEWIESSMLDSESIDTNGESVPFQREGYFFAKINNIPKAGIGNDGLPAPWSIDLVGVMDIPKYGYRKIVLDSGYLEELDRYFQSGYRDRGFNAQLIFESNSTGTRTELYKITKKGYCDASLNVFSTSGSGGYFYTISLFPFSVVEPQDVNVRTGEVVSDVKLISSVEDSRTKSGNE